MANILNRGLSVVNTISKNSPLKILGSCPAWNQKCEQRRHLNVQEHISYSVLSEAGIPVPKFGVAKTAQEAADIAKKLDIKDIVLKAQVLAGGRGKGHFKGGLKGGVKMVFTPEEAADIAGKMIGDYLITKQTGEKGRICNSVMVTERKFPRKEYYFAIMMERAFNGPVVIASSQGGVNIEEVAAQDPDAILYIPVDITTGLSKEVAEDIAVKVGLADRKELTGKLLLNMYDLFVKKDALLIEINPYAEDSNGDFSSHS